MRKRKTWKNKYLKESRTMDFPLVRDIENLDYQPAWSYVKNEWMRAFLFSINNDGIAGLQSVCEEIIHFNLWQEYRYESPWAFAEKLNITPCIPALPDDSQKFITDLFNQAGEVKQTKKPKELRICKRRSMVKFKFVAVVSETNIPLLQNLRDPNHQYSRDWVIGEWERYYKSIHNTISAIPYIAEDIVNFKVWEWDYIDSVQQFVQECFLSSKFRSSVWECLVKALPAEEQTRVQKLLQ